MSRALLLGLLALGAAARVSADVLPPPTPLECPSPSMPGDTHCGTLCLMQYCEDDSDCGTGEVCGTHPFCAELVSCGGWGWSGWSVYGECGASSCPATCELVPGCVPAPDAGPVIATDAGSPPREHRRWDCGCSAGAPSAGTGLGLGVVLVAPAALRLCRVSRGARGSRRRRRLGS